MRALDVFLEDCRLYGFRAPVMFLTQGPWGKKLPDETFLKLRYYSVFANKLNLKKPITFSEKLQWLKLYDRKPEYTSMVDKYEAKIYVAERLGKDYIIPTLGVWDNFDEIDFAMLPEQFVLKCTHDSGGLIICKNKGKLDKEAAKIKIKSSLSNNYYFNCREWPYKDVKPRIIAEKFMIDEGKKSLTDYKFYCFNGEPKMLYVSEGLENHETAKISFLTCEWEFAPFSRSDYVQFDVLPQKPVHYNKMLDIARVLSKGLPFLRVDLYEINEQIYFSELTFSPCGGFMVFDPVEWDIEIGKWISLPENK